MGEGAGRGTMREDVHGGALSANFEFESTWKQGDREVQKIYLRSSDLNSEID